MFIYIKFIVIIGLLLVGCSSEEGDWKKAKELNTINSYDDFLKKYNQSKYVPEAKIIIQDFKATNDFEKAKQLNEIKYYEEFLKTYPLSKYGPNVMEILSELRYNRLLYTSPGNKSGFLYRSDVKTLLLVTKQNLIQSAMVI